MFFYRAFVEEWFTTNYICEQDSIKATCGFPKKPVRHRYRPFSWFGFPNNERTSCHGDPSSFKADPEEKPAKLIKLGFQSTIWKVGGVESEKSRSQTEHNENENVDSEQDEDHSFLGDYIFHTCTENLKGPRKLVVRKQAAKSNTIPFKLCLSLLLCKPVMGGITGTTSLSCSVGDNACFKWNANNESIIVSATWGIKRGNVPDPQYIEVDIRSNKTHRKMDLEPSLRKRLSFDGNLKEGFLCFCLKNVTLNDTNEYLAIIHDRYGNVQYFAGKLTVKERGKEGKNEIDPTGEQSHSFAATSSLAPKVHGTTTAKDPLTANPNGNGASTILITVLVSLLVTVSVLLAFIVAIIFVYKKYKIKNEMGIYVYESQYHTELCKEVGYDPSLPRGKCN